MHSSQKHVWYFEVFINWICRKNTSLVVESEANLPNCAHTHSKVIFIVSVIIPAALNSLKNFYPCIIFKAFASHSSQKWASAGFEVWSAHQDFQRVLLVTDFIVCLTSVSGIHWTQRHLEWFLKTFICLPFIELQGISRVTALLNFTNSPNQGKTSNASWFFFVFQRIVSCCRPAANWGPYLACNRGERYSHVVDPKKEKDHEIPTVSAFVYSQQWDGRLDDNFLTYLWGFFFFNC